MGNTITFQQLVGHLCVYEEILNLLTCINYHVLLGKIIRFCNNNCTQLLPDTLYIQKVWVPPFDIDFVVLFT